MAENDLLQQLQACFDPQEVKWKPQKLSGNKALAIAYVDARVIQDRLDDVLGVEGWQDKYECLPDGSVVCRLKLKIGEEWITKMDVGSPSEQPDEHDRMKAAFSDALKRAAVKFGIGRYLYRLPAQWADYDPQKRQFVRVPQLPAWAVPGRTAAAQPEPKAKGQPRATVAAAICKAIREAPDEAGIESAKRLTVGGAEWYKTRDEHCEAVLESARGKRLALRVNRIEQLREQLGFGDVQMLLAAQQVGLADMEPQTPEDAAKLIAALEAEAGRVETEASA